jgi:hypothetical protein
VSGQLHACVSLLRRRLSGPQSLYGRCEKNLLPLLKIEPRFSDRPVVIQTETRRITLLNNSNPLDQKFMFNNLGGK